MLADLRVVFSRCAEASGMSAVQALAAAGRPFTVVQKRCSQGNRTLHQLIELTRRLGEPAAELLQMVPPRPWLLAL